MQAISIALRKRSERHRNVDVFLVRERHELDGTRLGRRRPSPRPAFRRYLERLLLPAERNKTLTALVNTEPVAGAQRKMQGASPLCPLATNYC